MKQSLAFAVLLASGVVLGAAAQTPAESAAPAPANTPPAAAAAPVTPKIAVIAFEAAVQSTNEFQRNLADIQRKYEPKRQQLKALSDEIDNLTKQLQTQGDKLNDAEKATRARQIDEKKKQLQRDGEDAQNDYQNDTLEMFKGLEQKVYDVLSTYAQKNGYTLVLDVAQQTPVLYAVESTDITKPVLDAYNVKSGVPAPPVQPGAPPAAPTPSPKPAAPKTPPASH